MQILQTKAQEQLFGESGKFVTVSLLFLWWKGWCASKPDL